MDLFAEFSDRKAHGSGYYIKTYNSTHSFRHVLLKDRNTALQRIGHAGVCMRGASWESWPSRQKYQRRI